MPELVVPSKDLVKKLEQLCEQHSLGARQEQICAAVVKAHGTSTPVACPFVEAAEALWHAFHPDVPTEGLASKLAQLRQEQELDLAQQQMCAAIIRAQQTSTPIGRAFIEVAIAMWDAYHPKDPLPLSDNSPPGEP